jgi:tetratricopeptide (TPR) repeat protein
LRTQNFQVRRLASETAEQSSRPASVRYEAARPWFALPPLLVLLTMTCFPAAARAGIPTPTSQSLCDTPSARGSAIYNKYCGGGGSRQSYVPQGPSPEELSRRQEEQRRQLQRQREAERRQNAEAADQKGLQAAARGDWREAMNRFIEALQFAPESSEIKEHLERANTALADVSTAAEILVLHQRVEDAITAANLNAVKEGMEDDLTAQRLTVMSESFRGQTAADSRKAVVVPVSAGTGKRLYPALKTPALPGTPPATVLAQAQPEILEVDKKIRRAQLALRRLIASNAQNEENRLEWVKVSEEATVEAQNLSVSLVLDLVDAHVDHLAKVRDEEGLDVLNHLLNRENGEGKSLHAAFGMLLGRKQELERIKSEIRFASKSNDLRQKISTFDLNRDTEFTRENLWDVVSQFKKVEEFSGPSKDLLDAAYTIYKQAASFENLSAIRANQEKTLQAAATLHKYIVRLEEQKRASKRPARH